MATIAELLGVCRTAIEDARVAGQTDYVQVVQNWGAQAGARTNHLCLDLYDLPQVPHRVAEELGGAARYVIREGACPWCRLVVDETARPDRLVYEDDTSVAFAPYASRSPFEVWIVPRRHDADFGRATDAAVAATAESLRQVLALLATLDGPPYNLVLHTAPLREQVDATFHWHWEIHPRLREIAGLEIGTGLPVNPVSPEDAVDELLRHTAREPGRIADPISGRN
jgi:UDPglucose--hexose-1-phosphate uridylyltransferase